MAVNKKNIMTRYFFVVLLLSLVGIAIVVKAGVIMFAEQQYWKDVADRFVREGVGRHCYRGESRCHHVCRAAILERCSRPLCT